MGCSETVPITVALSPAAVPFPWCLVYTLHWPFLALFSAPGNLEGQSLLRTSHPPKRPA